MENNNGRGIFYGVIGVATLVVAIIGATFAYFSAQVTATGNVTATTANIELGYSENLDGIRTEIIPVDTDAARTGDGDLYDNVTAFADVIGVKPLTDSAPSCKDTVGNQVCSVYQFTIKNDSPSAQTVYGYLNQTTTQTGITDMYYAMFVGTVTDWNVHGTAKTARELMEADGAPGGGLIVAATKVNDGMKAGDPAATTDILNNWSNVANATRFLTSNESVTYTIVLWIEETYGNQDYKGQVFNANVRFDTGTTTGVTGNLGTTAVQG